MLLDMEVMLGGLPPWGGIGVGIATIRGRSRSRAPVESTIHLARLFAIASVNFGNNEQ